MTGKLKIQIVIDFVMTALLPVLMAYALVGEALHEWAGVAMFVLFLLHHGLNWKWHKNLFRGRYTAVRSLGTIINVLIFLLMLALMVSGVVMSRYVFDFLPIEGGISWARIVHLAAPYWCYILISMHLGFHSAMLMGMLWKACRVGEPVRVRTITLRSLAALLAAYGVYAFVKRDFISYMLLRTHFAFFDFSEPLIFFFADYLSIMALLAIAGYYIVKRLANFERQTA
ncbi:MAG: DUF4405 domain-containing protein [Bacillota bacterium]|nr:DUF4405 domain-containing protein [Bacillota bacterium]